MDRQMQIDRYNVNNEWIDKMDGWMDGWMDG